MPNRTIEDEPNQPVAQSAGGPSVWNVPFQTKEQVQAYLSGDAITCLICGVSLQKLPKHLRVSHGVSSDDYRRRFNIPFTRALMCAKSLARSKAQNSTEAIALFRARTVKWKELRASSEKSAPRPSRRLERPLSGNLEVVAPGALTVAPPQALPDPAASTEGFRFLGRESVINLQFQTMDEVDDYLSGTTIMCLICGCRFQRLNRHLQTAHEITPHEYRREFGIPFSRGLTSVTSAEKSRAVNMRPECLAQIRALGKSGPKVRRAAFRGRVPAVADLWKKNAETGRYFARENVTLPCSKCGKDVVTTALCASQSVTCLDCTTGEARSSRLSYWRWKWVA
jgi:predicted transcriptional regulator